MTYFVFISWTLVFSLNASLYEGVISPGVADSCETLGAGIESRSPKRATSALSHWAICLYSPDLIFLYDFHGHQAYTWCMYVHGNKTLISIKRILYGMKGQAREKASRWKGMTSMLLYTLGQAQDHGHTAVAFLLWLQGYIASSPSHMLIWFFLSFF